MSSINNDNNDNDFEGAMEGIEEQDILDLSKCLTDAGKYSYAGLCAVTLHELFHSKWDRSFSEKSLCTILKHLCLPTQVEPIMHLILAGEINNTSESFISILMTEDILDGNLKKIIQDLISVAVQEGEYDARWRVLIRHLSDMFGAKFEEMELYEIAIVHSLTRESKEPTPEEKKMMKHKQRIVKAKRYALISLATIGGGTLIGLTGGLAAPLIGGGLGAILGTSATIGALSTAAGAAVVGTLFGAAGASLAGYKMKKRVGEIEEFAFGQLCGGVIGTKDGVTVVTTPQLDITIAISGWIKDESENNFTFPWKCLCISREQYYLRYESEYLLELGRALEYFVTMALSMATQEALKYTILSGLMTAISLPAGLLGLASVIDNPWGVCCRRSAQVGKQLAEVLLAREHGRRPVTLIGYSLGARVIYYCLREMSERSGCEGVIQDAYLIGGPCSANPARWNNFTRVVAGTITNAYCKSDWLLKFLYRTLSFPVAGVSGLQPIELTHKRLRNIDLSHIVTGHSEYPEKITMVLRELGVRIIEEDGSPTGVTKSQTIDTFSESNTNKERPVRISMSEPALSETVAELNEPICDSNHGGNKHEGNTDMTAPQGEVISDSGHQEDTGIVFSFSGDSDEWFDLSPNTEVGKDCLSQSEGMFRQNDKFRSTVKNVSDGPIIVCGEEGAPSQINTSQDQHFKLCKSSNVSCIVKTDNHPLSPNSDSDSEQSCPERSVRNFPPTQE